MTNEKKQQFTLRITQANRTELVVILYEMTLCYLEDAGRFCEADDRAAFKEAIRMTRGCLLELMNSLHMEYEIAINLMQLYQYCIRRLSAGEVLADMEPLYEINKIITKLYEAYVQVAAQDDSAPVMHNSQAVYAGLTYGRNDLTENMANQGTNRGFLI